MKKRIGIVEDDRDLREALAMMIQFTDQYELAGSFENAELALEELPKLTVNAILMDIYLPGESGIICVNKLKSICPSGLVLMCTSYEDDEKIFQAISAGADGYILKKTPPAKLLEFINEIMEGGAPMTPSVARQLLLMVSKKNMSKKVNNFNLTKREFDILELLVKGYSYKMIAEQCNVSYATVNSHVSHIYEKLHVSSGTEAVAKAIEHKIVN